jgi:hypothetical protein
MNAGKAKGQEGAAMIEAAFMLFFMSFFLMFIIYGYTLFESMTRALEDLRYEWREKSEQTAGGDFNSVSVEKTASMKVEGVIGDKLTENPVTVPLSLKGYAGSWTGEGRNSFAEHGTKTRKITITSGP